MRLELLMRRMAVGWTLSEDREWILDCHPRRGSITLKKDELGTCIQLVGEKMRKTHGFGKETKLLRCMFSKVRR